MGIQERKGKAQRNKKSTLPSHVKQTARQLQAMRLIIGNLLSPYTKNIKFISTSRRKIK